MSRAKLQRRANYRRAVTMSIVVGTLLILINHGDHILEEPVCSGFYAKLFLTYLVPFTVSLVSSIMATKPAD